MSNENKPHLRKKQFLSQSDDVFDWAYDPSQIYPGMPWLDIENDELKPLNQDDEPTHKTKLK